VKQRPDLAALAFCGLVVIGVVVLSALRVPVPDFLSAIGMFVAGVGGGAALNTAAPQILRPPAALEDAPAANLPAQRAAAPAAPAYDPAATGVFARVVTGDH
jgi:hypothetical protein